MARLIIREEQLRTFTAAALDRFVDQMLEHAKKYFPSRHTHFGEAALRLILISAIEKARTYGIRGKRDVCKFINATLTFGPDFDQQFSVLRDILVTPQPGQWKARRLSETSLAALRKVKEL